MGSLLTILRGKNNSITTDIFIDFENAKPTDAEKEVYSSVEEVISKGSGLLETLQNYTGQAAAISKAISSPSKETEEAAWNAVVPQVIILKDFYEYSTKLDECIPKLLQELCSGNVIQKLEERQATAKLFADLLHFVLLFDDLKMTTPSIQNDFSYYRRTLSRLKMTDAQGENMQQLAVRDELANYMTLFFAVPTPMLNAISTSTSNFVNSGSSVPSENVTECLATMASICYNAVAENKFEQKSTELYCLRVMVGVIILYDHIHPEGAFCKTSSINIKQSIKLIQGIKMPEGDGLLNALRYTTKHLNDDDTPKQIKALLAV
eukprot:Lithocolla_globosa_v1_NODE_5339_length_1258_cov_20.252702.p1 type:complete len:321 gc:universal NODE_5339_length_1258_cov_20.252702:1091-129(-)